MADCPIAELDSEACDNGFSAAAMNDTQWRALVLQLLCNISDGSGSTGLFSGDYSGIAPVIVPSTATAIAFDTITGTQWNWYSGSWH